MKEFHLISQKPCKEKESAVKHLKRWREQGQGGEMTQTLYAHMNKRKINKKKNKMLNPLYPHQFCVSCEIIILVYLLQVYRSS
jgi:hypothetical protein